MPIRTQALLLFNLFVTLLTIIFAWRAASIASQAVQQRIVQQTVSNTASFLATQNFPMGDHLLSQLNRMFDVQFVAIEKRPVQKDKDEASKPDRRPGQMIGTSLTDDTARAVVAGTLEKLPERGMIEIGPTRFFFHANKTQDRPSNTAQQNKTSQPPGSLDKNTVLYVLIPESQLTAAAKTAFWGVVRFGLIVLVLGSIVTWFFAEQFTRPIRQLAHAMDHSEKLSHQPAGTSDEIRQLYRSFTKLLARQEQSRQVLVDSERLVAIGRMAAAVAHELRNPLSGIKMNLQVLRDETDADDPSLELALKEVDRMELYLKEIMHLIVPVQNGASNSHRISPSTTTHAPTCQPTKAIRAVAMLFAGRSRHAGIDVVVDPPDTLPLVRLGDSEYRQVLANLLINAIEATPEGGTIRVSATIEENTVKTTVSDTGPGVFLENPQDPFQIFTSSKVDGTGLGLYICKKIVEDAAGQIGYENHTDSPGVTFWFDLPINSDA